MDREHIAFKKLTKYLPHAALFLIVFGVTQAVTRLDLTALIPATVWGIPFHIKVITFIGAFVVALSFHEFSHVISFRRNSIQIRAMALFFSFWIKEQDRWRFSFRIHPYLIGGLTIAELPPIEDEKTYETLRRVSAKASLAGPIGSIVMIVAASVLALPLYLMDEMTFFQALAGWFHVSLASVTALFLLTSFAKSEVAPGDFCAYRTLMRDDLRAAVALYMDIIPTSDYIGVRNKSRYLLDRIDDYLRAEYAVKSTDSTTLDILETELSLYLAERAPLSAAVLSYIHYFTENEDALLSNKRDEELCRRLMFRIIAYLIYNDGELQAKELFTRTVSSIKHKNKVMLYYIKQGEHLLGLQNNVAYLKRRRNIRTSSFWPIASLFPVYYEIEEKINGVPTLVTA
jgi:hypothetical protein